MRRQTGPPLEAALGNEISDPFQPFLHLAAAPTLFLDANLNILFFTPAISSLINIRSVDIGRSLFDLSTSGLGEELVADIANALSQDGDPEREITSRDQRIYRRRVARFVAQGLAQPGVSMTFVDLTDVRQLASELGRTRKEVEIGRINHLSMLSVLSHDLRQPLQTLKLLQALLRETLHEAPTLDLAEQIGHTLSAMSVMINEILQDTSLEADAVIAHRVDFQLNTLLQKIAPDLQGCAREHGARLRIVPCHESIHSDPRLLEQMIHALLSLALLHTANGRLLLGCRRHRGWLSLEIRTQGGAVAQPGLDAEFTDIQRLGAMLGHQLHRQSGVRGGTVYAISIALSPAITLEPGTFSTPLRASQRPVASHRGIILIVEDDADLLKLLGILLHHQGYEVAMALDSAAALSWIFHSGLKPDLILADYHLGTNMSGLELIATLRNRWRSEVPAIVLTGDVSSRASFEIAAAQCTQLHKPAKLKDLIQLVHAMFAPLGSEHPKSGERESSQAVVYVVDSDSVMRDTVRQILQGEGYQVNDFATAEAFLSAYRSQEHACLLIDARLPALNGIATLRGLRQQGDQLPTIIISGSGDIGIAVEAMRAGAWDFIEKPCDRSEMLDSINRALGRSQHNHKILAGRQGAIDYIASLTTRQRQIMDMVLAGHPSKNIAVDLGISQRTVENHRASIMTRTHSRSIPALARLALAASLQDVEGAALTS